MNEEERYNLAFNKKMSSFADIRYFARNILLEEGVDIDIVNLKEDGVSIESFKKLVRAVYIAGYKDGLKQNAELLWTKKKLTKEGKVLTQHQRNAKYASEQQIYKL